MPTHRLLILFGMLAGLVVSVAAGASDDVEAFEKEVRPILVENCQSCHGAEKQKGSLRLDARAFLIEGGDSGPAVEPGEPGESLLIQAVKGTDESVSPMPPGKREKLSPPQVEALERWIAAGAAWPDDGGPAVATRKEAWASHWAFQPIADPDPPKTDRPDWVRTPIDAFILDRLDDEKLAPSPPADRRTLIRRLTYDLTGLPPTPEEVEAFVADPDPAAYEKLVDRLLASEHYGEQWARHWLDVARYSDTKGYVYAREERFLVQASAYRDWVVKAFNDDLPYDRFLLDQIAADQADPEDPQALAAMGFLTVGRRFLGVTPDVIDDKIDVLTRGTMGLTVACSRCHDHKFDPIPTADYYSLYGVFQNCAERLTRIGGDEPRDEAFEAELDKRQTALRDGLEAARAEASRRARARVADYLSVQLDFSTVPPEGFETILAADDLVPAFARRWRDYLAKAARADDPIFRFWRRLAALDKDDFPSQAAQAIEELTAPGAPPLNTRVAEAFATPPATIAEAAQRYGALFAAIDAKWNEATKAPPPPLALPNADDEALRRVLYEPNESPCFVPNESVVTIEGFFDTGEVTNLWRLQGEVDRWIINAPQAPAFAVAVVDRLEIREPKIFVRGSAANPGDEVPRRFLKVISGPDAPPFTEGSGRLELAEAIVDPENPLTARVWVNRIWTHHFGEGLVNTPSDFGVRADPPSHPELLDWLARRLIAEGWRAKPIHRLILLSSSYQQRSNGPDSAEALETAQTKDPENRLLWRANPRRLGFEEYRDSLLVVTGELDPRIGGKPAPLFTGAPNVRRTLYGLIDRQFVPGTLRVFDFANPDLHVPTRSETTVPQQALFAMNHPFFADRARALAARHASDDADAAIRSLYRAILQREPTSGQLEASRAFLDLAASESEPSPPPATLAWSHGYGSVNPESGPASASFAPLPHFNGEAWGGGANWPDPALGWARLTAEGGHPGNDLNHAVFRRWTSPVRGTIAIESTLTHDVETGDGVRGWIVHGRLGVLKTAVVHNAKVDFNLDSIAVEPGDVIDFVVDIRDGLNSDQFLWAPQIRAPEADWDASRDFGGPAVNRLKPWEQLAQTLLMSNEFMFVD